jgi:hypothetical protein
MSKKETNEGLFDAASQFTNAFFNGISKNTSDRILKKAKQRGLPKDIIDSMERIEKEKDELYAKLKKANKK